MIRLLLAFVSGFAAFFRSRHDLGLELLALRQQVSVLKRKNPRPKLSLWDRLFWLGLRRWWSQWASVLVVVKPETVVRWHRAGFGWLRLPKTRLRRENDPGPRDLTLAVGQSMDEFVLRRCPACQSEDGQNGRVLE